MLKNKEDDFLGDEITNNIKYGDNSWQSFGTISRESSYTKEPILHLLFEGFDYTKDIGDYKNYVARASTSAISDSAYIAAKLQHDLYVLDTSIYITTSTSCSKNIFSLKEYLRNAIAISNPLYDSNSLDKKIDIFNVVLNKDNNYEAAPNNGVLENTTVFDILKYFLPEFYTYESTNNFEAKSFESSLNALVQRYVKPTTKADNVLISGVYPDSTKTVDVLNTTVLDFLNNLKNIKVNTFKDSNQQVLLSSKTVAEIFLDDFSLHLHNPENIKMPFYNRGLNNSIEGVEDNRLFKTRFIANAITKSAYETVNISAIGYMEYLNDLVEESIYANETGVAFYNNRSNVINAANLTTNTSLAKEVLRSKLVDPSEVTNTDYEHLYKDTTVAETTLMADFVSRVDSISNYVSLYCPDVFTGYSATNTPKTSWALHFLNEEVTENLFQDVDNTYKLYNNLIVGYQLADTLIAYRTFAGAIYYFIKYKENSDNLQIDVPFRERITNASIYDEELATGQLSLNYYPTITALNAIYKIGHGANVINLTLPEKDEATEFSYDFAKEIKDWLANECFLFKGNVYGDYVEELNFMQDLTPDSSVHFNNLRLKKTNIVYNRFQDSKYEVPYIEQTAPLVNNTIENKTGIGVYGSDALASVGNIKGNEKDINGEITQNTTPPFIYDYDKGDQSAAMADVIDPRLLNVDNNAQRINSKNGIGNLTVENRITSPTIDELWTFLKYLTESDGSGINSGINERLPQFYGIKKDLVDNTLSVKPANTDINTNTVNPLSNVENPKVIDILNWEPISKVESRLHWSSLNAPELQFGGYKITRYIEKIYDYTVEPFKRRSELKDGDIYEYNTEIVSKKNIVTGYLEKLYNSAILVFDLPEVSDVDKTTAMVNTGLITAHILNNNEKLISATESDANLLFTTTNDEKLITSKKPVHSTEQRKKAFDALANILNYHKADGVTEEASLHNHYKKYLANPKNLKEIERDLETIRQNLQTLVEFTVVSFPSLGYADRAINRGTIHQLHKNAYDFDSTLIQNTNNTKAVELDEVYDTTVLVDDLEDSLNNIKDDLTVTILDKKVVFEDGDYQSRYLRSNYDKSVIDLNSNTEINSRAKHQAYRPNENLISEVYLAADGTWRSIYEHTRLNIVYDEH